MSTKTIEVQVKVYVKELLAFFAANVDYGTKANPYPADAFFEISSVNAAFYGPLKNILVIDNDISYNWILVSPDNQPISFSGSDDDSTMELELIPKATDDKSWKKIFKNAPKMQSNGKLKVKTKSPKKNEFELQTTNEVNNGGKIKYSFTFEFQDSNSVTKYGIIDPWGATMPLPPQP